MENDDQYVKQLEEIFNEFCLDHAVGINKEQLLSLAERLSLNADSISRLFHLAFGDIEFVEIPIDECIAFDQFCQCFVSVLSEISEPPTNEKSSDASEDNEDSIKPRLVRGGKKYGRKSAPNLDLSNIQHSVDFNENPDVATNNHWAGEMLMSSDEDGMEVGDKIYYEPGFGGDVPDKTSNFKTNHTTASTNKAKDRTIEIVAMSTEDMGSMTDATSNSTFFQDGSVLNIFSKLDPDGSGTIETEALVESWRKSGVEDPIQILEALDISHRNGLIDAFELSTALEKEVMSDTSLLSATNSRLHASITYALVTSYKGFVHFVNSETEQYKNLTEKMKDDLEKSELRTSKLIDEVDDRYLSMDQQNERKLSVVERKWAKKLSSVQHAHERERDTMLIQFNQDKELFHKEIDQFQYNEECLRKKMRLLQSENDSLSRETVQLCDKLSEAEKDADRLRKDLECLLNEKTNNSSNPMNTSQEEKFAAIIKEYENQCRHLADKNDELAMQVESLHGRLKQFESGDHNHGNSVSSFHEERLKEGSSPKRKKPQRRDSNLSDYVEHNMENDATFDHYEKLEPMRKRLESKDFSNMRMAELERLVEDLRADKRNYMDGIAEEKAHLKAQMEKEFQIRLEDEKAKFMPLDDNRAVEEQQTSTMRLLKQITQEKDELESKYLKLKQKTEDESSESQHGMADLCREFAQEKAEVVAKHEEEMKEVCTKLETIERRLSEEVKASERFAEQLKTERLQHNEALAAHQEVISKFERNGATVCADSSTGASKVRELTEKFEAEVNRLKQEHASELGNVKRGLEAKLEELLAEKSKAQESASMCSELDRLQESIGAERRDMHDRLQQMREAFEKEAGELRRILDCDKAKLRQQLNDEVASLRQRLAEETEKEMKKKRDELEESERNLRLQEEEQRRENKELIDVRSQLDDLKTRNQDLEKLLSKANSDLRDHHRKRMGDDDVKNSSLLEDRIGDVNRKLTEKEQLNLSLRSQIDDLQDTNKEKSQVISRLQNNTEMWETDNIRLKRQYDELLEKVRGLEHEKLTCRLENAGLNAKCEKLEKSGISSPVPSPRVRSRRKSKLHDEEQSKGRKHAEEKISEMTREIADLKAQLTQLAASEIANQSLCDEHPKHADTDDDDVDGLSVSSQRSERSRLTMTRQQLNTQMRRTKDLYSKLSKSETLVKELYCENSHLMRALQVSESRQKEAERRCEDEKDRCQALGRLLQQVCPDVP